MEENKLISKFQLLKQIKPRKEWVFSVKNEILSNNFVDRRLVKSLEYKELLLNIFNSVFQRKFAYAFAVFLFVFLGISSVDYYLNVSDNIKIAQVSPAALMEVKDNVETFKIKSQNLSEVSKDKSQNISLAIKEVRDAAKELTVKIKKDPQLAKSVALEINNNKTYLDVIKGEDLKEPLYNLYKTTVDSMIESYDKTTLTPIQQKELDRIKNNLLEDGNYTSALENILLMMNSGI